MKIFIVDDEKNMTEALKIMLQNNSDEVFTFTAPERALKFMEEVIPDIVITDLKMKNMDGIEFVEEIKKIDEVIPVIIMTAYATVETAVRGIKSGAYDYILKPFEPDTLKIVIEKALKHKNLLVENREFRKEKEGIYVGSSLKIKKLLELVESVAITDSTVLIRGESGTGKEVISQLIYEKSGRRNNPFIKMNCAAIPENLIESELFGHVKGAFTGAIKDKKGKFELANGGTLFLDEIGDLSLSLQTKFLRVLQEKEIEKVGGATPIKIDVRLIAATHRNLENMIKNGEFREDLYYRLNVFPILIPPLREHKEDILELSEYFVKKYCERSGLEIKKIDEKFIKRMMIYDWPGNIRELSNFIERAIILSKGKKLDFPDSLFLNNEFDSSKKSLEDMERKYILQVLAENNGNRSKTAEILKIDRTTLYRLLKKYENNE